MIALPDVTGRVATPAHTEVPWARGTGCFTDYQCRRRHAPARETEGSYALVHRY